MADFTLKGLTRALANLRGIVRGTPKVVDNEFFQVGFAVMRDSQPLVPVDTGFLKNSWVVTTKRQTSHGATAEDVSGVKRHLMSREPSVVMGYTAEYASFVHETHGTNAGFLRNPLIRHMRELPPRIQRGMRTHLGRFRV